VTVVGPGTGRPAGHDGTGNGVASSDFVRSLARGLDVIKAFGPENPQMTLSEVARATGLTRAAARRFLLTLAALGYVRSDGRDFSLRPKVLELGYAYLAGLSLNEVAAPHLEDLVAQTRESSSVAVLDGEEIVYVVRVPTKRIMAASISVGTRFPAHATSMGRVLLAHLPDDQLEGYLKNACLERITKRTVTDPERLRELLRTVRAQGYAMTDQELEEGLRSAAVPLRDGHGTVVAAMNISTHASRVTMEELRRNLLPQVVSAARLIETDMAAREGRKKP
jgi:IclR family transcriptional regulator, pca regulon regulatory protein